MKKESMKDKIMIGISLGGLAFLVYTDKGGGPLLLFFTLLAFFYGSILFFVIKWFLYSRLASVTSGIALKDSLIVHAFSTIVVGFGFTSLVCLVTDIGHFLPSGAGDILLAVGTWVNDGKKYHKLIVVMTAFWL